MSSDPSKKNATPPAADHREPIATPADQAIHHEASAYLAAIVESANDAIISKDLNGIIMSWNAAAERIFGYRAEEMIGKPVLTFIPPERADEEKMILGKIRNGERVDHFETIRVRKDGTRITVSLTVSPVKDASGRIIGASKIARDITDVASRIKQQRAVADLGQLALRENDLQQLCDRVTSELVRILGVDLCKVLQLVSHGQELLLRSGVGWKEGLVGKAKVGIGPDSQAGHTLTSSHPIIVEDLRKETRFNGPPLLIEHGVISGISCIILGENQKPWGVLGAHTISRRVFNEDDVTFLQAVANILASCIQRNATERRFRLAVEAAPNGMVMVDERGVIQMVNGEMEKIFGYSREEMLGQPIEMLLPQRYCGQHRQERAEFAQTPEIRAMGHGREVFAHRRGGSEVPVEVGLNPIETPEGTLVLAAVIDISQRKRMEAELAEAHAELRRRADKLEVMVAERTENLEQTIAELESVSYSLSHDMRAPLRTVHSFTQIVLEEAEDTLDQDHKELLEKVISSAARLDRLIRDVLIYSRVSRNAIDLESLNLESLLRQIISERSEFQPPHANVLLENPLLPVRAHEAYLTQCITNLLDNAVKFVSRDRKPQVRIWTQATNGDIQVWFEDNGPGIPEEARERIFGIFQRAHPDNSFPGTGIGLAIVRRAVERMGGKVHIEPAPEGGTRFCLQLLRGDAP